MSKKPLSPIASFKIRLIIFYLLSVVLCIFWLAAEVDITRRVKLDRITSENALAVAERGLSDGDTSGITSAGERLLDFYSVAKRNSEPGSVLAALRRGYPKLTQAQLADIGGLAAMMLQSPESFSGHSGELSRAVAIIHENVAQKDRRISDEAAEIFAKVRSDLSSGEDYQ